MRARVKVGAAVVLLGALAGGGAGWATAGGASAGDDRDEVATGAAAERARAAAVAHLGGGRATGVERESEGREAWEVEVTRADGSTVDVSLDESYHAIAADPDSDRAGGSETEDSDTGESDE